MHGRRWLVLSPHTDDAELACGGTIARAVESGLAVFVVVFSSCEQSLPPDMPPDTLKRECTGALDSLGVNAANRRFYGYPVREFPAFRQEILDLLVLLRKEIRPDVVLLPSPSDVHQDHQTVCLEGLRAFKSESVLGFELPWNQSRFNATMFVELSEQHVAAKWRALEHYKSQLQLNRHYFDQAFVQGLARVRGVQAGSKYAEAFEVVRINWRH